MSSLSWRNCLAPANQRHGAKQTRSVVVSAEIHFMYDLAQRTAEAGDPEMDQKRIMQRDTLSDAFRKLAV